MIQNITHEITDNLDVFDGFSGPNVLKRTLKQAKGQVLFIIEERNLMHGVLFVEPHLVEPYVPEPESAWIDIPVKPVIPSVHQSVKLPERRLIPIDLSLEARTIQMQ